MPVACTDAEWKIMQALWAQAPQTVAELTRVLEPETAWTRHTIITLLKRMQEKGSVTVDESGPVRTYSPRVSREQLSEEQTTKFMSRVFGGKPSLLINQLVDTGKISVEEMSELVDLLRREGKQ